ncbi:alpha/beta hydrolase [Skermania sp. ID1734]|uniref:alpha/beta hydrolase n=1 Tax=Skermania sp. ID1734 TaxID=2597516 RepID=UPI00163D89D8|nr:alpha/beta hydrolase [Skermania sp. ID1734]
MRLQEGQMEGKFTGAGGKSIFWQAWLPDDEQTVRGVVVISHGMHEHGGRYEAVAETLVGKGFAVYAVDHAGHGRSDGARGDMNHLDEVVADLDQLIMLARQRHPNIPVFLLGHSAGGLIALSYVTARPRELAGLILSAPAVDISVVSPVQKRIAGVIASVAPKLPLVPLDSSLVSRDPAIVEYHRTNPLMVHNKMRARSVYEGVTAAESVQAKLSSLTLPLLVMTGTEDKLVSPNGARMVVERASSADKTYHEYDGLYHEIFNEPERETVLADLVDWLDSHV